MKLTEGFKYIILGLADFGIFPVSAFDIRYLNWGRSPLMTFSTEIVIKAVFWNWHVLCVLSLA